MLHCSAAGPVPRRHVRGGAGAAARAVGDGDDDAGLGIPDWVMMRERVCFNKRVNVCGYYFIGPQEAEGLP